MPKLRHVDAEWSDSFFNWGFMNDGVGEGDEQVVLEDAKLFIQSAHECPYTAEELAADFLKRL